MSDKVINLPPERAMTVQGAIQALDNQPVTVEQMICRGIDRGLPVDTMERLLAMRRELKAEQAKEAFDRAMAAFQADCPAIHKNKAVYVKGALRYRYAPLEVIIEQVKQTMAQCGFSHKEDAIVEPGWVTGICKVTHTMGHSESTTFKVPIDKDAFMGEAQKFASAFTFTKRYAFCAAFGIMTADEDDDSVAAGEPKEQPQRQQQPIQHPRNTPPAQAPAAPKPAAPAPQQQQGCEAIYPAVSVLMVAEKSGMTNGKPWKVFFVKVNDGFSEFDCGTFDEKIATVARDLYDSGANGRLITKPGRKEGSKEIVSLERASDMPSAPLDADLPFDNEGQPMGLVP
jgi:hypothetical protein